MLRLFPSSLDVTHRAVADAVAVVCPTACRPDEQRTIGRLTAGRHAPGDWILPARIVGRSRDGQRVAEIATALGCHPKTVRQWLHRFNAHGVGGLGDLPRSGRPPGCLRTRRG